MTHICVGKLTIISSDNLVAWTAPSHYLNQCWNIVNLTLGNKLQWNTNRNLYIFIQENAFENVVWKMVAILSRPQCVKNECMFSMIFNSLATGRHGSYLKGEIFKLSGKSVLLQVMGRCCLSANHNLSQCWSRTMPPYGITRPQVQVWYFISNIDICPQIHV